MQTNQAKVNDSELVDAELEALLSGMDEDNGGADTVETKSALPDGIDEMEVTPPTAKAAKPKTAKAAKPKTAKAPKAKAPRAKVAKTKDAKVTGNKTAEKSVAAKTPKPKKESKPRLNLNGMKPSVAVKTILGDDTSLLMLTKEEEDFTSQKKRPLVEKRLAAFDELAKKQGEKVINIFKWLHTGAKLKAFTSMAIQLIIDKGTVTSAELKQHYMDRPYAAGTSNSVSNQMMTLLPALGIAERDGKTLSLVKGSTIVAKFKAAK